MKNAIQLIELNNYIDSLTLEAFLSEYELDVIGSNNYFRYYPNISEFDEKKGNTKIINNWLKKEGYFISKDKDFHLLIKWQF